MIVIELCCQSNFVFCQAFNCFVCACLTILNVCFVNELIGEKIVLLSSIWQSLSMVQDQMYAKENLISVKGLTTLGIQNQTVYITINRYLCIAI